MKSLALLVIAAAMAALGMYFQDLHDSLGPPAQRVNIRWAATVSSEERLRIEQDAGLRSPRHVENSTWNYLLANRSRGNIGRLVRDPRVEDTFQIDRQALTVTLDRPELAPWLRALLETDWVGTVGLGLILLALVIAVLNWRVLAAPAIVVARTAKRELHPDVPLTDRRRRAVLVAAALLTLIVLILTVNMQLFDSNFFAMTGAQSILSGDLPFRDYFDPGVPLAAFTAAGMQLLTGPRLIGEFLRQWAFIVAGVVMACHLGLQLSRSSAAILLILPVTLFLLANEPTYHYPKLFFFPLMIWAGWRYLDLPGPWRAATMGVISALGFLERHDFGIYLGFASVVALLLARAAVPSSRTARALFRDAAAYAGGMLIFMAPWIIVVQGSEGLLDYTRGRAQLYQQGSQTIYASLFNLEILARLLQWRLPARELVAEWLVRVVLLLPIALLVSAVATIVRASRRGEPAPGHVWKLIFSALFLALLGTGLFRQVTYVVVTLPVSAALASVFLVSPSVTVRALTAALVAISTVLQGMTITGSPLLYPRRYVEEVTHNFALLTETPPGSASMKYEYIRQCTRPTDHVLVTGNNPLDVSYLSQRPIAGGQINWHRGWLADREHAQQALKLIQRQSVPLVVADGPALNDFAPYPDIAAHLRAHYREVEGTEGQLLVDSRRQPTRRFGPTGYPCFR